MGLRDRARGMKGLDAGDKALLEEINIKADREIPRGASPRALEKMLKAREKELRSLQKALARKEEEIQKKMKELEKERERVSARQSKIS